MYIVRAAMSASILIHLCTALLAVAIGAIILLRPKGTSVHKTLGRSWVVLILVVSISTIWIQDIRDGRRFSFIHLLSIWTVFAVTMGFMAIRRGRIERHRGWMVGTFIGLVAAGPLALFPGRKLSKILFG